MVTVRQTSARTKGFSTKGSVTAGPRRRQRHRSVRNRLPPPLGRVTAACAATSGALRSIQTSYSGLKAQFDRHLSAILGASASAAAAPQAAPINSVSPGLGLSTCVSPESAVSPRLSMTDYAAWAGPRQGPKIAGQGPRRQRARAGQAASPPLDMAQRSSGQACRDQPTAKSSTKAPRPVPGRQAPPRPSRSRQAPVRPMGRLQVGSCGW